MAGRHQIDLAGADDLLAAQAVAVQYLSLDHPGESLQADVRMGPDLHAGRRGDGRAGVVEEAPGPYFAQRGLRNGSVDGDAADIGYTGGQTL
ncbi:hypothetical protein Cthiooxydans_48510 [Comamonas thiooxydans]|nr:hypothetical protein Cthiooxydans_48510 [Comamonas thiooxydans]